MERILRTLMIMTLSVVFLNVSAQTSKWRDVHKVKKSETLFGIANEYGVSIQELIDANPEMKKAGYQLKKGDWVFVPYAKKGDKQIPMQSASQPAKTTTPANTTSVVSASSLYQVDKRKNSIIHVGVMLPLHNNDGDGKRMVEYYRGMLLAFNQLKVEGINTEVNAWNVPIDADIRTVLLKEGVDKLDIVFGPLYSNMVKPLGDYCKAHSIKMVIPFLLQAMM